MSESQTPQPMVESMSDDVLNEWFAWFHAKLGEGKSGHNHAAMIDRIHHLALLGNAKAASTERQVINFAAELLRGLAVDIERSAAQDEGGGG